MRRSWALLSVGAAGSIIAAAVLIAPEMRKPATADMRSYLVAHLSDEQLRAIAADAKLEFAKVSEADAQYRKEANAAVSRNFSECLKRNEDPAQELRYGRCGLPLGWPDMGFRRQNEDEIREAMILGLCAYVDTIHQARERGCLPPKLWTKKHN